MALRGVKPKDIEKRLKMLLYGPPGAGKTTCSIQFPKPYLVDTEKGAENSQYVKLIDKAGGAVFQTTDFDEMVKEVKALLSEKHQYRTLIIDPITTVYDDLVNKAEQRVGSEFGRHYSEAKKQWKRLGNLLLRLDMNVIITCHQKNMYGDGMKILGVTYDGPKGLDYLFDLVVEVSKKGKDRVGTVRKTRIEAFEELDVFPFSYAEVAKRHGKTVLEREAKAESLASEEQVTELTRLVELLKIPSETTDKWLDKANASDFTELPADSISKCIEWCHSQIKKGAA